MSGGPYPDVPWLDEAMLGDLVDRAFQLGVESRGAERSWVDVMVDLGAEGDLPTDPEHPLVVRLGNNYRLGLAAGTVLR